MCIIAGSQDLALEITDPTSIFVMLQSVQNFLSALRSKNGYH